MKVSEIFFSLQGEGPHIGYPAIFLRLTGCNLECPDCDSKYSWKEGGETPLSGIRESIDKIMKDYNLHGYSQVGFVITGGEPMLQQPELIQLLGICPQFSFIDIETNGTIGISRDFFNEVFKDRDRRITIIVSPKIGTLGKEASVKKSYRYSYFKFVVEKEEDLETIKKFELEDWHGPEPYKIFLMPKGIAYDEALYKKVWEWCKKTGYRFSPRLHIMLYGNKRGI